MIASSPWGAKVRGAGALFQGADRLWAQNVVGHDEAGNRVPG